jgi:predicted RNA binding protein YcfA (HicA-like mRNA interferase family)
MGFYLKRIKGSHHIYYNESTKRLVVVPVHHKEIPKGTLLEILRQTGLSKEELDEVI